MSVKKRFINCNGDQIFHDAAFSSTNTVYSDPWRVPDCTAWSLHLVASAASSWSATFTLQASNVPDPNLANDDDWVDMDSDHGWDGLPGGDPSSASSFDAFVDVSSSNALQYRLKGVNSAGTATLQGYVVKKRQAQ